MSNFHSLYFHPYILLIFVDQFVVSEVNKEILRLNQLKKFTKQISVQSAKVISDDQILSKLINLIINTGQKNHILR